MSTSHHPYATWNTCSLGYIEDHALGHTLQELGDHFRFSPEYISALIKKKTGKSFILTDTRMTAARYYLKSSDLPVSDIAERCGYSNKNFFYQKFRQAYGMTPDEYRLSDRAGQK